MTSFHLRQKGLGNSRTRRHFIQRALEPLAKRTNLASYGNCDLCLVIEWQNHSKTESRSQNSLYTKLCFIECNILPETRAICPVSCRDACFNQCERRDTFALAQNR